MSHLPLKSEKVATVFKIEGSKTVPDLIGVNFTPVRSQYFLKFRPNTFACNCFPSLVGKSYFSHSFGFNFRNFFNEVLVVLDRYKVLLRLVLATSRKVRSSQTIFIRIIYTSQFYETVGSEAFFDFLKIRYLNF